MQYKQTELKNIILSGIFIFSLAIVVMASIFILGKENSIFEKKAILYTHLKNAENLREGSAVKLKGIKVGKVRTISIDQENQIKIEIYLSKKYLQWIKEDSHIEVKTLGVLGDKYLEILGGSKNSSSIPDKGNISIKEGSQIEKMISRGENITQITEKFIIKLDQLAQKMDIHIDKTSVETNHILKKINKIKIEKIAHNIDLMTSNFNTTLSYLNKTAKRIDQGPGTLHSIIYDQDLYEDLKVLLGGANRNKVLKYFIRESINSDN